MEVPNIDMCPSVGDSELTNILKSLHAFSLNVKSVSTVHMLSAKHRYKHKFTNKH